MKTLWVPHYKYININLTFPKESFKFHLMIKLFFLQVAGFWSVPPYKDWTTFHDMTVTPSSWILSGYDLQTNMFVNVVQGEVRIVYITYTWFWFNFAVSKFNFSSLPSSYPGPHPHLLSVIFLSDFYVTRYPDLLPFAFGDIKFSQSKQEMYVFPTQLEKPSF